MQNSSQPKLLPVPFADNGSKQDIPNDSQVGIAAGRASYTDGFPPLTRTPLAAGGVPPFGTDFNGVLNDITAALRWSQVGAGYPFNAAFNTAISGYPKGARIPSSTLDGFWLNTTDGNSANPENTTSALTGWVPSGFYGTTAITGLSGSSITLTTLQAARERITLAGALTSNINLTVPAWIKRWEIVNNCTGLFNVTVKTPSGTGVSVAAGSIALVQGDGTNINQAASPGSFLNIQSFPLSATYVPVPGTKKIRIRAWGAGGSGSGTATSGSGAGGGGGGGYIEITLPLNGATSIPITVGKGGTAIPANNATNGVSGGDTLIPYFGISAKGGGGGASATGGIPSTTTGVASLLVTGQSGQGSASAGIGGLGGSSFASSSGVPRTGGPSDNGGYPGGASAGASYPSGGTPRGSGSGADGLVIIEEYA
ncbi:glycine-rich domain-containing protein [Pantoea agglomerans]|uniref:glycine-rich domain-containing protein n=1 Tax=Enterobacter agglomerans TaxID=549 RepID=UPI003C7B4D2A